MTTADEHLKTLRQIIEYETRSAEMWRESRANYAALSARKVAAVKWILELNGYGVTSDEIVG